MAKFTEVWNEWRRMCEHKQLSASCCTCPLSNLECNAKFPKDQNHYDGHAIEEIIMGWAEEHREPVYPTWIDWLRDVGVIPTQEEASRSMKDGVRAASFYVTAKAFSQIPADIAEKLGLEPKEGYHG